MKLWFFGVERGLKWLRLHSPLPLCIHGNPTSCLMRGWIRLPLTSHRESIKMALVVSVRQTPRPPFPLSPPQHISRHTLIRNYSRESYLIINKIKRAAMAHDKLIIRIITCFYIFRGSFDFWLRAKKKAAQEEKPFSVFFADSKMCQTLNLCSFVASHLSERCEKNINWGNYRGRGREHSQLHTLIKTNKIDYTTENAFLIKFPQLV